MNRNQVVYVIAWAAFNLVVVQPLTAQAAHHESNAGVSANGPGEGASSSDKDSILVVLRGVETAFSESDLLRWLSYFHTSFLIMAPDGVIAPSAEDEAIKLLRPHVESLRNRGYARSELHRATVKLLSETTALAAVEWIRRKSDDEELERVGATYALFEGNEGWKIVMVTVHSPASLLEFN